MAKNLRDEGYPASHIDPRFKSRKVNYAQGEASAKRTEPTNTYMRGEMWDLDDNHQQDYINTLLDKVKSPLNVNRWNERTYVNNADWQDQIHKGYSLNQGDTRLAYLGKNVDPYGVRGNTYSAVLDNLTPIVGDGYVNKSINTPLGNLNIGHEDGSAYVDYTTPSLKEQMYYINALKNLLNRG